MHKVPTFFTALSVYFLRFLSAFYDQISTMGASLFCDFFVTVSEFFWSVSFKHDGKIRFLMSFLRAFVVIMLDSHQSAGA